MAVNVTPLSKPSLMVILLTSYANLTMADSVTLHFEGTISSTGASTIKISEVSAGDKVTGHYTFSDSATDGRASTPTMGLYSADQLSISVGQYTWTAADNTISVANDVAGSFFNLPANKVDFYELVSPLGNVSGPNLSGLAPGQIEIISEKPDGARGGHIIFGSATSGKHGEIRFKVVKIMRATENTSKK